MSSPLLLVIDGNSLLHRAYHALERTGQRTGDGRPSWAVKGLWTQLLAGVNRLDPAGVLLAFDDAEANNRKDIHSGYKAQRVMKHDDLRAQLDAAPEHFARAGIAVVTCPGCEADDVLASAAGLTRRSGWRCVVATSDRDAFALISDTTSVLRILNGGVEASPMLTPARLVTLSGIRPEQYSEYAALRGDPSDNLPGVAGIGPKTAVRLLAAFPSVAAAWSEIDAGGTGVADAIGTANAARLAHPEARERFALNLGLMSMRSTLPLPGLDEMRIPIPAGDLLAELDEWGLDTVRGQAEWLLTAAAPPRTAAQVFVQQTLWD